jgi:hypothetical protein
VIHQRLIERHVGSPIQRGRNEKAPVHPVAGVGGDVHEQFA